MRIYKILFSIWFTIFFVSGNAQTLTWTSQDYYYELSSAIETYNNNYLITGIYYHTSSDSDRTYCYFMKLNSTIDTFITRGIGKYQYSYGKNILLNPNDSSIYIIGSFYNLTDSIWYPLLLKIDENGDTLFSKVFYYNKYKLGGSNGFKGFLTNDNYIIIGSEATLSDTGVLQNTAFFFMKMTLDGDTLWSKVSDVTEYYDGSPNGMLVDNDNNMFAPINIWDNDDYKIGLVKLDSNANLIWKKKYLRQDLSNGIDFATFINGSHVVQVKNSPSLYWNITTIVSDFFNEASLFRIGLLKSDSQGDSIWFKYYGDRDTVHGDIGGLVKTTSDNNIILGGTYGYYINHQHDETTNSDYYVHKIDTNGNVIWARIFGDNNQQYLQDIVVTSDGGFLLVGTTSTVEGLNYTGPYIVKVNKDGNITGINDKQILPNNPLISVYPNPSADNVSFQWHNLNETNFEIKIYDILGKQIINYTATSFKNYTTINIQNYKTGIYSYKFVSFNSKLLYQGKIIKQ